jgi:hypothetical protein
MDVYEYIFKYIALIGKFSKNTHKLLIAVTLAERHENRVGHLR